MRQCVGNILPFFTLHGFPTLTSYTYLMMLLREGGGSLLHEYSEKVEKQINTHELHVFITNKAFIYLILFHDF
jgi:hypothetical protein